MPVSQLIEDMTGQASQKNDFNIKGLREVLEETDKTLEYYAKMTDFSDHAEKVKHMEGQPVVFEQNFASKITPRNCQLTLDLLFGHSKNQHLAVTVI